MAAEHKGVPAGAAAVIPRLVCRDVEAEIEFCRDALGAVETVRRPGPDGRTAHAMLMFGPAMLMLESEWPALPSRAPNADGSSPVVIFLYVEDVDAVVERAVSRGGKIAVPVETHFWGDRIGWVQDPKGHMWTIATRVEETTEEPILGSQVSVQTSKGRRVVDHLTQNAEGKIAGVEVKSGKATRNPAQRANDAEIANPGGKVVGKNAPENLRGRKVKFPTEERHYPD